MDLGSLSNHELENRILEIRGKEKEATLSLLYHLIELDSRKLYRELGYSSLFDFCQRALKYSEGSSYRRVSAARAIRENPELGELFLKGEVTLCTIAAAAKGLKEKSTEVLAIVGKSKREVQALVAPEAKVIPREAIKPVVIKSPSEPLFPREERKEEIYRVSFSLTKDIYRKFERVRDLLSSKLRRRVTMEAVFEELLNRELKRSKRALRKSNSTSRYIPLSTREDVRDKCQNQCSFVSDTGVRCTERRFLQFDHQVPYSRGGATESSNLRLLCPSHNLLNAERDFGRSFIETFTGGGK